MTYDEDDPPPPGGDVLDTHGAAALLLIGERQVQRLVAAGEIPHRRIGRRARFSRTQLIAWVAAGSHEPAKREARKRVTEDVRERAAALGLGVAR